jgi:hypothetical protein
MKSDLRDAEQHVPADVPAFGRSAAERERWARPD